jgi:hypothetical protein
LVFHLLGRVWIQDVSLFVLYLFEHVSGIVPRPSHDSPLIVYVFLFGLEVIAVTRQRCVGSLLRLPVPCLLGLVRWAPIGLVADSFGHFGDLICLVFRWVSCRAPIPVGLPSSLAYIFTSPYWCLVRLGSLSDDLGVMVDDL